MRVKDDRIIARAVNQCVRDIPALIHLLDVNCRLMGMPILARDLLMLMCQDENRNLSWKLNAAKKKRGEVVKLGRWKIFEGTQCLAFLTIGVGKT